MNHHSKHFQRHIVKWCISRAFWMILHTFFKWHIFIVILSAVSVNVSFVPHCSMVLFESMAIAFQFYLPKVVLHHNNMYFRIRKQFNNELKCTLLLTSFRNKLYFKTYTQVEVKGISTVYIKYWDSVWKTESCDWTNWFCYIKMNIELMHNHYHLL